MNLKLNSEARTVVRVPQKAPVSSVKEERRRNGRYIAVLVGICLFLLAIYHAWIRRIPVVASLVVPALIMFVYVGWVLYTASRDKHRLQDAEAALDMDSPDATVNDIDVSELSRNNLETIIKESSRLNSPGEKNWPELTLKGPIILINDEMPDEEFQVSIDTNYLSNEKLKDFAPSRKFKRKFCRSKRHAVFKRSYSIA